jgi:CIC family chloride channel protein
MGAGMAHAIGCFFRRNKADVLALVAAGAGAGLATAFNAPVGGAVFLLEEVVRRLDIRHSITTLGASACAIAVSRVLLGGAPDFNVAPLPYAGSVTLPLFMALGVAAGLVGVAYNHAILAALAVQEHFHRWPVEARAALIGAAVGLAAWFIPDLVGGGEEVTQRVLAGGETLGVLSLACLFRFALGPVSYSAATPGGLFAPILAVGAQGGLIFGILCSHWLPGLPPPPMAFAVVGMAAFFTACVRAPVTGIALITEMTGSFTLLLPLVAACFTAMVVPTLLHTEPIYDSLREPAGQQKGL